MAEERLFNVTVYDPEEGWRLVENGFGETMEDMTEEEAEATAFDLESDWGVPYRVVQVKASRRARAHPRRISRRKR